MTRRVRLGPQADGTIGLRVSAAGFDALTAPDDGTSITFDSRWTDIARVHAIGIVAWRSGAFTLPNAPAASNGYTASWPDPGFKPFAEIRRLQGNVVLDDFFNTNFPLGSYTIVERTAFFAGDPSATSDNVLFCAYRIPVPSG
jgi:hypothetical protein